VEAPRAGSRLRNPFGGQARKWSAFARVERQCGLRVPLVTASAA